MERSTMLISKCGQILLVAALRVLDRIAGPRDALAPRAENVSEVTDWRRISVVGNSRSNGTGVERAQSIRRT